MSEDWGRYIEAVATALFGKPTSRGKGELRFGRNGSFKVNLETGFWDDWESGDGGKGRGGGVLALIEREKGLKGADAIDWMRTSLGLDIEDRRPDQSSSRPRQSAPDSDPRPEPPQADPEQPRAPKVKPKLVKTYDYISQDGELLFQVCRMEPKTFMQRRPARPDDPPKDVKGDWVWKRDGIVQVPYRLPELVEAIADERLIFVVEGEKDVDNLVERGAPSSCNAGGAGKWPDELTPFFAGADIVIIADNDPQAINSNTKELRWHPDGRPVLPGQDHAKLVASKLAGTANSIRILMLPDLPPKGDASDWLQAGGTTEALYRLVDETAMTPDEFQVYLDVTFPPKKFVSKFGAVVWGEPRTVRKKYEYLIKGLIPRRETVLIYGASQSGKSFLTQDLSMGIALGGTYCGRKVKRGIVVYCAPEAGLGFVDRRMPGYAAAKGLSESEWLPFVCLPARLDLFGNEKQVADLIEEIKTIVAFLKLKFPDLELEAVIIDTFNKATPGLDEISGKDMSLVLDRFDKIRDALDCGLWIVHHKNAAGTGPRGHTSLFAGFETAIEIGRLEEKVMGSDRKLHDKRFMKVAKQREGEDNERFEFCLRGVELGVDEDGDPIRSAALEWIGAGKDQTANIKRSAEDESGIRMTDQNRICYRALRRAIDEFGTSAPASLGLPKSVERVVQRRYWTEVYRRYFADDSSDDAVKKALTRANNFMINNGIIGRDGLTIWITGKSIKGEPKRYVPPPEEEEVLDDPEALAANEPDEDVGTDWSEIGRDETYDDDRPDIDDDDPDIIGEEPPISLPMLEMPQLGGPAE
ncbi:AAA family ATPase [Bradyrhizobium sp. PMVTL-01]|uniref:AAA family ATPase n=1 Tax=Bradyrhizobium sp. PMVTL-01 TaxID=3434999 RepID=UPI003F6F2884